MMNKPFVKTHWILFALIILLVVFSAIIGWVSETLYSNNTPDLAIKSTYYDLSILIIVLPVSLTALILSIFNNQRARLFTLGLTVYLIFSYGVTIFTCRQNNIFLIYIAILTISAFYFIKGFAEIYSTFSGTINKRISKFVSISLLFSAISGIWFWLFDAISALSIHNNEMLVKAPQVLDMAFVLPFTIYGAIRLWRNKADGILISSIMMIFFVFIGISVIIMELGLSVKTGIEIDYGKVYSFSFISLLNIIITILTYRKLLLRIEKDK